MKKKILVEITKADHQLSESFYFNEIYVFTELWGGEGLTLTLELWKNDIFLILMWNMFILCRIMQLIIWRNRRYENVHYDKGLCKIEIPTIHV